MPLLIKNGKLVINDIDQLVFSDDPDSCRCCPGACECPSGSYYATPKYISDMSTAWSNIPDTYTETKSWDILHRLRTGATAREILDAELTISGMSAINGTWPGKLATSWTSDECEAPSPVPDCPYNDTRALCSWFEYIPVVSVTGTYKERYFYDFTAYGTPTTFDYDNTYFVNGFAVAYATLYGIRPYITGGWIPMPTEQFQMQLCISNDPYGNDPVDYIIMGLGKARHTNDPYFFFNNFVINQGYRYNCTETVRLNVGGYQNINESRVAFPPMVTPLLSPGAYGGIFCSNPPVKQTSSYYGNPYLAPELLSTDTTPLHRFVTCSQITSESQSASIPACSGAGSDTGLLYRGGVFDASWSYSTSAFAWDYTRTINLAP